MEKLVIVDRTMVQGKFGLIPVYRLRERVLNKNKVGVDYAGTPLPQLKRIIKSMNGIYVQGWK